MEKLNEKVGCFLVWVRWTWMKVVQDGGSGFLLYRRLGTPIVDFYTYMKIVV